MSTVTQRKKELGTRLKSIRNRFNQTQEEFANRFSLDRSRYGSYEIGKNEPPLEILLKICELAKVSLNWLVTGEYDVVESQLINIKETQTSYLIKQLETQEKYSQCLEENKRLQQRILELEKK